MFSQYLLLLQMILWTTRLVLG